MIPDGIPIRTSPMLKWYDIVQKRTHRKKRINKKWRKQYGYKSVSVYKAMLMNGEIWVHPDVFEQMTK